QDWLYRKYREHKYNSSVMRFNIGDFDYVWQDFLSHRSRIMQMLPGDQDWITDKIPEATKWPDNWCISYKWDKAWANIPQQTKIVVFHGTPNPPEAIQGTDKYPPAPWIANLWR